MLLGQVNKLLKTLFLILYNGHNSISSMIDVRIELTVLINYPVSERHLENRIIAVLL